VLTIIAVSSSNNKVGAMKVIAQPNLERKVVIVDSQISLSLCLPSDSSEMCIPNESENASATAIVSIPPIITSFEPVKECNPTINPRVVITPEVKPKHKPVFNDSFNIKASEVSAFLNILSFKDY
jgi:hypothetical protein